MSSYFIRQGRWQDVFGASDIFVDHLICDPPYNDACSSGRRSEEGDNARPDVKVEVKQDLTFGSINDSEVKDLVELSSRVVNRWSIAFCAIEQVGDYEKAVRAHPDLDWVRGCVWVKTNAAPQFSGDRPAMWGESMAVWHARGAKRWNRGGEHGRWIGHRGKSELHPTQKPLWLMFDLVESFTEPGETILDPYMGSGTTGVAAVRRQRSFVGTEADVDWFDVASERLAAASEGADIHSRRAGQAVLNLHGDVPEGGV